MLGQNGKRQNETNIPNYADTGAKAAKQTKDDILSTDCRIKRSLICKYDI